MAMSSGLAFAKLEALGNDFVLLDFRDGRPDPPADRIRALADRHTGIGFDQLLILRPTLASGCDVSVHIYNADGSRASQCGNGMRAIGLWLHRAAPEQQRFTLETDAGPIAVEVHSARAISVSMGQPDFDPAATGLAPGVDPARLARSAPGQLAVGTVSVGNPHLVLLLDQPATPELVEQLGRDLAGSPHWAQGVNVSFACIDAPDRVRLRVHERGAGPTLACGSAACATAAWLLHQSRVSAPVQIEQPGGTLVIDWRGPGQSIQMTGPARHVFDGTLQ